MFASYPKFSSLLPLSTPRSDEGITPNSQSAMQIIECQVSEGRNRSFEAFRNEIRGIRQREFDKDRSSIRNATGCPPSRAQLRVVAQVRRVVNLPQRGHVVTRCTGRKRMSPVAHTCFTETDSGSGPPTNQAGWIRTGFSGFGSAIPGQASCQTWSTTAGLGTLVSLNSNWFDDATSIDPWNAGGLLAPWSLESGACRTDEENATAPRRQAGRGLNPAFLNPVSVVQVPAKPKHRRSRFERCVENQSRGLLKVRRFSLGFPSRQA